MYKLQWLKSIQYTLLANTSVQKLSTSIKLVTVYYCVTVYFLLSFMILLVVVSAPHLRPCLTMICWCSVAGSSILQNKNWNNFKSLWRRYNRCVHLYRDALVSISNYYIHWNPGPNSFVQYACNDIRVLFRALPVFILPWLTTKINLHIFLQLQLQLQHVFESGSFHKMTLSRPELSAKFSIYIKFCQSSLWNVLLHCSKDESMNLSNTENHACSWTCNVDSLCTNKYVSWLLSLKVTNKRD